MVQADPREKRSDVMLRDIMRVTPEVAQEIKSRVDCSYTAVIKASLQVGSSQVSGATTETTRTKDLLAPSITGHTWIYT